MRWDRVCLHSATAVLTVKYTFPELIFPDLQFSFYIGASTHNYFLILIIMRNIIVHFILYCIRKFMHRSLRPYCVNFANFCLYFFSYCSWGRVEMHMSLKIHRLGTLELRVVDFYFLFCSCSVVIIYVQEYGSISH